MNLSSSPHANLPAIRQPIVIVGMMGSGKTSIGKRLAERLGMAFYDSDQVLEADTGISVADYFARHGEAAFRREEAKTIAKLLDAPPAVLSLGGGAFINDATRTLVKQRSISVWLTADLDILLERALRQNKRPLLKVDDPRARMQQLLAERSPLYAEANLMVINDTHSLDIIVERVQQAVMDFIAARGVNTP